MQMTDAVRRLFAQAVIAGLRGLLTGEPKPWVNQHAVEVYIRAQGDALKEAGTAEFNRVAYKEIKRAISTLWTALSRDSWPGIAQEFGFNEAEIEELLALPERPEND